jgi:hypothetical protein
MFHEECMRIDRNATQHPATAHTGDHQGAGSWILSVSFVELQRDAAIILNEVLILACHIFGR